MRLTTWTDNALRTLTFLAIHPDEPITVGEIAARMRMSEDHVFKVVAKLAADGYVETQRGRNGGVRLTRDPAGIVVGKVVRDCEESFALVACFDPNADACPIAPACVLAGALDRALAAFLAVLDDVTLADLTRHPRKLAALV